MAFRQIHPQGDVVEDVFLYCKFLGLLKGESSGGVRLDVCDRDEDISTKTLIIQYLVDDHLMTKVHPA